MTMADKEMTVDDHVEKLRLGVAEMPIGRLLRLHAAQAASCSQHGNVSGTEFWPVANQRALEVIEEELERRLDSGACRREVTKRDRIIEAIRVRCHKEIEGWDALRGLLEQYDRERAPEIDATKRMHSAEGVLRRLGLEMFIPNGSPKWMPPSEGKTERVREAIARALGK